MQNFKHKNYCICGYDHYSSQPLNYINSWASVSFVKGRFLLFPRNYLDNISIGYKDLIDPLTEKYETGYNTKFTDEGWIAVDDLAFQLSAKYVLIPELKNPAIKNQPSSKIGLWRKKGSSKN